MKARVFGRSIAIATALLTHPVLAQSTHELQRALDDVMSVSTPAERAQKLTDIYVQSPNGFVYVLQTELRNQGFRAAQPNGLFTSSTIREMTAFCEQAGIAATCALGPLTDDRVPVLAKALFATTDADAPDATRESTPANKRSPESAEEISPSEPAAPAGSGSASSKKALPDPAETPTANKAFAPAPAATTVFGPVAIDTSSITWITAGASVAGTMVMDADNTDLRRAGIYDVDGQTWIDGPRDYEPDANDNVSISFQTPDSGGPVRIYPLRGRDNQSWLYTAVPGLKAATPHTASWHVFIDGDQYTVTDLTVTTP
jgi:hypothetical protein